MKQQLGKKYIYQLCLGHIAYGFILWLFLLLPSSVPLMNDHMELAMLVLLVVLAVYVGIVYLMAYLWWKNYTYELQPESFVKHYGVISLRNTNIPYERIQNININRPLVSRIFGLSQLHIQTAGNSAIVGAEGRLPGLSADVAEKLRDELIHRSKGHQAPTQYPSTQNPIAPDHSGGL